MSVITTDSDPAIQALDMSAEAAIERVRAAFAHARAAIGHARRAATIDHRAQSRLIDAVRLAEGEVERARSVLVTTEIEMIGLKAQSRLVKWAEAAMERARIAVIIIQIAEIVEDINLAGIDRLAGTDRIEDLLRQGLERANEEGSDILTRQNAILNAIEACMRPPGRPKESNDDLPERVMSAISRRLADELLLTRRLVARDLDLPEDTLKRKLKNRGTTYTRLKIRCQKIHTTRTRNTGH